MSQSLKFEDTAMKNIIPLRIYQDCTITVSNDKIFEAENFCDVCDVLLHLENFCGFAI